MAEVVVVESSDESDDNIVSLSGEECKKRCQEFVEITGTDSALAMFFLQDREWNLEASLNAYFQSSKDEEQDLEEDASPPVADSSKAEMATTKSKTDTTTTSTLNPAPFLTTAPPVLQPSKEGVVRILSWNIDGLDPDNLQSRTMGVCSILKQENPEVIFLQEVVVSTLTLLETSLGQTYHVFPGHGNPPVLSPNAYFTAMLLRRDCVDADQVQVADFPCSTMSRNLLMVQASVRSVPVTLMTSHLESTATHHEERGRQLQMAFKQMAQAPSTAVFGGDLNLRDKELKGASAKPSDVYDIWESTGKRPEAKFTWDLIRNDNKQMHGKFQPRCRFDRMYIRHPQGKVCLKPVYFELVGIQRLASCRRFPSDHWGIMAHLSIV